MIAAILGMTGGIVIPMIIAGATNNNSSANYGNLNYERNARSAQTEVIKVSEINNQLTAAINLIDTNRYGLWNEKVAIDILPIYNKYITILNTAMKDFITVDGKIIGESIVARYKTVIKGLNAKSYYLGDNGSGILDAFENQESENIFSLKTNLMKPIINESQTSALNDITARIDNIDEYVAHMDNLVANLKLGLADGVNFSQIYLKMFLQSLFGGFTSTSEYGIISKELLQLEKNPLEVFNSTFVDVDGTRIALFANLGYLQDPGIDTIIDAATQATTAQKDILKTKIDLAQAFFDKFLSFIMGEYWFDTTTQAATPKTYYGLTKVNPDAYSLKVDSLATDENAFPGFSGMGFVPTELDVKDVGIGFSRNSLDGVAIYEYMVATRTTDNNLTAASLVKDGKDKVLTITQRMGEIASIVAEIKTGNKNTVWVPKADYDPDGYGPKPAENITFAIRETNGSIDLKNFFLWLNNEEWFYGRDKRPDQTATVVSTDPAVGNLTSYTNIVKLDTLGVKEPWNPPKPGQPLPLVSISIDTRNTLGGPELLAPTNIGHAGNLYDKWEAALPIQKPIITGGINGDEAYIGATHSINSYLKYKESTQPDFSKLFKNVSYDYILKTGTGGAAYEGSERPIHNGTPYLQPVFYLDVDPYFGLQKWSVSSLSTHEAVPGHGFQFAYANTYPSAPNAPSISSTAYTEGWALFTEFLATRINVYGDVSPITFPSSNSNSELERLTLPKFGANGTSIQLATQNTDNHQFDNGVYGDSTGKQSQVLYEALQYFGFLNERQLRAMRLYLDAGSQTGNGSGQIGTGLSINDQRAYMSENSALGFGDISRESYRYLGFVAQATSYTTGLEIIENAYVDATYNYEQANPGKLFLDLNDPVTTKANTEGLFDLILRNGPVALEPLENYVNAYVTDKFPPPVTSVKESSNTLLIVGITLGSILVILAVAGASFFLYKRNTAGSGSDEGTSKIWKLSKSAQKKIDKDEHFSKSDEDSDSDKDIDNNKDIDSDKDIDNNKE